MLIDMLCHLHMASVSSSRACCVLCSLCYLACSFQRSPGALLSPPHIKASLISATLIATHPMIISLGLMCMRGSAHTQSYPSLFYISVSDMHAYKHADVPHMHAHARRSSSGADESRSTQRRSFLSVDSLPLNEVRWSPGIIFQTTWKGRYINDMKWYKLTDSSAP